MSQKPCRYFIELGTGLATLVSRFTGAGDQASATLAIGQAIILSNLIAIPIAIGGYLLSSFLLEILGAGTNILRIGIPYLRICFIVMPILVLPFLLNAALRALGNAALVTAIAVIQLALLSLLMPVLTLGFGIIPRMEATGAILAIVITRATGTVAQLSYLCSSKSIHPLILANFRPHLPTLRSLLRSSLSLTGQYLVQFGAAAVIVRLVAKFGAIAVAGYAIAYQILQVLETIGRAMGNAVFVVVGQNMGAGHSRRALHGMSIGVVYSLVITSLVVMVVLGQAPALVAFFNADPSVVYVGSSATRIIAASLVSSAIALVLTRFFHGTGDTVSPLLIDTIVLWCVQLPLALVLCSGTGGQVTGIWIGIAVANVVRTLMLLAWLIRRLKHQYS